MDSVGILKVLQTLSTLVLRTYKIEVKFLTGAFHEKK